MMDPGARFCGGAEAGAGTGAGGAGAAFWGSGPLSESQQHKTMHNQTIIKQPKTAQQQLRKMNYVHNADPRHTPRHLSIWSLSHA